MKQAQYSTQEQLVKLREHVPPFVLDDMLALKVVGIANKLGLYDAADFVQNQIGSGNITLEWRKK